MSVIYIDEDARISATQADAILSDWVEQEDRHATAQLLTKCVYEEYFHTMSALALLKDITS